MTKDGKSLALSTRERGELWDLATGKELGMVRGHNEVSGTVLAQFITGCGDEALVGDPLWDGIFLYGAPTLGLQAQIIGNTIEDNQGMFGRGGSNVISAALPLIENNVMRNNKRIRSRHSCRRRYRSIDYSEPHLQQHHQRNTTCSRT